MHDSMSTNNVMSVTAHSLVQVLLISPYAATRPHPLVGSTEPVTDHWPTPYCNHEFCLRSRGVKDRIHCVTVETENGLT